MAWISSHLRWPPTPPDLTLSDRPEAVEQGLSEDPLQAPPEGPGLSPEPWQLPQTWHPAQPCFSVSDKQRSCSHNPCFRGRPGQGRAWWLLSPGPPA